ncbi:hypothetical protein DAH55_20785 [Sphingomonas koreensis]|nr:hypothetical protein BDW16_1791 [Sphingomonas koreensis]RSU55004.1 hypothetical protein DAH56_20755 [Sphingomonas koreensis]RSU63235.1 hypothetical protein DAH55_20785 [Sphingomonas koreensis]
MRRGDCGKIIDHVVDRYENLDKTLVSIDDRSGEFSEIAWRSNRSIALQRIKLANERIALLNGCLSSVGHS